MESIPKPRVSARDFFLWLGAMVALYVSAISLVILFHQYINVWFPDVKLEPYGNSSTGGIRNAIAFLIVFFPLYVLFTRMLHQDLRKEPAKRELWVRRWLIYLTLFVAGIAMAVNLVMLVNTFLNGALTMRFGMQAVTIFVVIGFGFWYYLEELKGKWEEKEGLSKAVAVLVSLFITASVVGAFFIVVSPATERLYLIDDRKINDLSMLQSQVLSYWQTKGTLPPTLAELADPLVGFSVPNDSDSGLPYGYEATGILTFELCAAFNKENRSGPSDMARPVYPYPYADENWQHGEGETCFTRTIDPDRYPSLKDGRPVPIPF